MAYCMYTLDINDAERDRAWWSAFTLYGVSAASIGASAWFFRNSNDA